MTWWRGGLALVLFLSVSGCTCSPRLQPTPTSLRVEPAQVDFGRIYLGRAEPKTIELINAGKNAYDATWTLEGAAFSSAEGLPVSAVVGSTFVTLLCAPGELGALDGRLSIAIEGFEPLVIPLACEGVEVPLCAPSSPCVDAHFELAISRCVEDPKPDGVSCQVADVCLGNPVCRRGRCEGSLMDCKDTDPCTVDGCHPSRGCEHVVARACADESPCRVGRCVTGSGCEVENAADGTPCGPARDCRVADVCVSGACVQRDPPDGFRCLAGPCGSGTCVNDVCMVSAETSLEPNWALSLPELDGGPPEAWSDMLVDRDGELTVSSYFMTPLRMRADGAMAIDGQSGRRCIAWLGWIVCGDLPAVASAPVSAIDPVTGFIVWSFTQVTSEVPELVGNEFFTARLAVLNENELLALYESRPSGASRCRHFAAVILDRQGHALRSRYLSDPIFEQCNHPHSYGVATDFYSNLFLSFSPSLADNPATSVEGTTVFSFSPALLPRWKVSLPNVVGGELTVGDGLVFLERDVDVRESTTGNVAFQLSQPFGQGVVASGVALSQGASQIEVRSTIPPHASSTWAPRGSVAGPVALADWDSPWGHREIALFFTTLNGTRALEARELQGGALAFQCQVDGVPADIAPAQVSVLEGGVGVMQPYEANACAGCDPKFARTRNAFWLLPVDGIVPLTHGWTAAWGDAAHSHHEGP